MNWFARRGERISRDVEIKNRQMSPAMPERIGSLSDAPSQPNEIHGRSLRALCLMVGQHGQEGYPGADCVPVLFRHHSRNLGYMPEVVHHPRRE